MRLATFNVLNGRSLSDGRVDIGRLRDAVAGLDVDVLGLQEVDRAQPRSGGHDLTAETAAALGAQYHRFVPAVMGTPGRSWVAAVDGDHERGDVPAYGVGLVSRFPVRRWAVTRLAAAPIRSPILLLQPSVAPSAEPTRPRVRWLRDEPRVLLAAVVDTPIGPMTIATTHLSFVPGWNGRQLRLAVRALRQLPEPHVLLGDLNLPGRIPAWLTGWQTLATLPTYPADEPRVQLDHVLAWGQLPPVRAARAVATPLSDHRALVVDLSPQPFAHHREADGADTVS